MDQQDYSVIVAPREGVNDDVVRVLDWLVKEGDRVEAKQAIVVLETAKSTFELEAELEGFLFPLAEAGSEVPVGSALALLADKPERPRYQPRQVTVSSEPASAEQVITKKARALIEEHGLALLEFAGLAVVRTEDVEAVLRKARALPGRSAGFAVSNWIPKRNGMPFFSKSFTASCARCSPRFESE